MVSLPRIPSSASERRMGRGASPRQLLARTFRIGLLVLGAYCLVDLCLGLLLGILRIQDDTGLIAYLRPRILAVVAVAAIALRSVIGALRDITEMRRTEEELRWKTAFLEAQVESSIDGILVVGLDGKKLVANSRLIEMWNLPREIVDDPDYESQLEWVASMQKDPEAVLEKVRHLYAHPQTCSHDFLEFKSGMILERFSMPVIGRDGAIYGRIWTYRDITKSRRTEEELRWKTAFLEAQFEATIDGLLVVDSEGRQIAHNRRFVELWGLPSHVADDPDDRKQVDYVLQKLKDPDQFVEKVFYLYDHENEESRDEIELKNGMVFDRFSRPVIGSDGSYYGRIWSFRDITESRRAKEAQDRSNQELREALDRLVAANAELTEANRRIELQQNEVMRASKLASLGTMAAGIAHEINNPLVSIAGYAEALLNRMSMLSPEQLPDQALVCRRLQIINDEAFRCKKITQGLLLFSRESSLDQTSDFDINHAVLAAVELMHAHRIHSPESSARIELTLEPVLVHGDHDMLVQVFLNLGMNAFDAMDVGKLLYISVERGDENAVVRFRDEGAGMDKETVSKMFDPFFTTKEVGSGTGLGLSVSQNIIEQHNGTIAVESAVGVGTTITLTLPLASAEAGRLAA